MNELLQDKLISTGHVASLALYAAAGACFAFSAGGHEIYAESAQTPVIKHHEEDLRDQNMIPAVLFEGLVALQGISLIRKKNNQ